MGTTDLTNRAVPLDMTPEEFRKVGHRLVDDIAAFLESLPRRPVAPDETPREVRSLLPSDLPETGTDVRAGAEVDRALRPGRLASP